MKSIAQHGQTGCFTPEPAASVAVIECVASPRSILLLRRIHSDRDPWSGHFAFPGGRKEREDSSIFATCLRELEEETGIILDRSHLREELSPTPAGRNVKAPVLVQPYLFEIEHRPPVIVEPAEIASFRWLEVELFRTLENHRVVEVKSGMVRPVFPLEDYFVWGFTYGILCRLLDVDSTAVSSAQK